MSSHISLPWGNHKIYTDDEIDSFVNTYYPGKIADAYSVLSDPDKRKVYDKGGRDALEQLEQEQEDSQSDQNNK